MSLFDEISITLSQSLFLTVITTRSGNVSGIIQPSSLFGFGTLAFHNIPYAEAPVGELRFAKPQPRKPWNGKVENPLFLQEIPARLRYALSMPDGKFFQQDNDFSV